MSKAKLEGAFAGELGLLQQSAGYMRLVKDRILYLWEQRRAEAKDRTAEQERRVKAIQQKLDRLDDAFVFAQTIDSKSYERKRDRLREELTLAQNRPPHGVGRRTRRAGHSGVRRTHPATRVRPVGRRSITSNGCSSCSSPEGVAFDGNRFNRTAATEPLFKYLPRLRVLTKRW